MKYTSAFIFALSAVVALTAVSFSAEALAQPIFVDVDALGSNDGASWTNAYVDLQDALSGATNGDEIWVAEGTYFADGGTGDRTLSFILPDGVRVLGGFVGTETDAMQRDPNTHVTALSGEIGDPAIIDDNTVQVVKAHNMTAGGGLDGAIVTRGYSFHAFAGAGGAGISIIGGAPEFRNLIVTDNSAGFDGSWAGGGIYSENASPVFENVTVSGNLARQGGGGMYAVGSTLRFDNVRFEGNQTFLWGGGLYVNGGSSVLHHVDFVNNIAAAFFTDGFGGGLYATGGSSVELRSVVFDGNVGNTGCGAIAMSNGSLIDVLFTDNESASGIACVGDTTLIASARFYGNEADNGAVLGLSSNSYAVNLVFSGNTAPEGALQIGSSAKVSNATFVGNGQSGGGSVGLSCSGDAAATPTLYNIVFVLDEIDPGLCTMQIGYSILPHGLPLGATDLGDNLPGAIPQFIDIDGPDNTPGTVDDDFRLVSTSPGVDAGYTTAIPADTPDIDVDGDVGEQLPFDVGGSPRVIAVLWPVDRVDMGAYETEALLAIFDVGLTAVMDHGELLLRWDALSPVSSFVVEEIEPDNSPHPLREITAHGVGPYETRLNGLTPGVRRFRIQVVELDGSFFYSEIVEVAVQPEGPFVLSAAYPNPTAADARVVLGVRDAQYAAVELYDLTGRRVSSVFSGQLEAGARRTLIVDTDRLAAGVYMVRARGQRAEVVRRLVVTD